METEKHRWIFTGRNYKCSNCGRCFENAIECDKCDLPNINFKYCPKCGTYMGTDIDYTLKNDSVH